MHMSRQRWFVLTAVIALVPLAASGDAPKGPPTTKVDNVKETLHGKELVDPYRWLEDQNSAETRAWLKEQIEYTESIVKKLPGRDKLTRRLEELMKVDSVGTPVNCEGRYFFSKRLAGQDLYVIYMRQGLSGKDEVLIDPHGMSKDKSISVAIADVSDDGKLLAYSVRHGGEDEVVIKFFDVESRKEIAEELPKTRYMGVSITPDRKHVYYATHDRKIGPRVKRRDLGKGGEDVELFGKDYGVEKIITCSLSQDGKYLTITVLYGSASDQTELYYKDVAADGPITPIVNDVKARFSGRFAGDRFFVTTNYKAPNNRLLEANLKAKGKVDDWKEVIPESKHVLQGVNFVGGKLFANYLENVSSKVKVYSQDGKFLKDISFPVLGTGGSMSGRWDKSEAFYSFTSFALPPTTYRYDVETEKREEWARLNVPIHSENFEVKQVWFESKDKTKVPMFIVHKKGLKLDGNNPTFLTGYGGFNISRTPAFSATAVAWIEQGGVYALPNLRGGGEFGKAWHEAGKLDKKQNVFDDFIAAAEFLIKEKYTRPEKLAIAGGSNGGLLVGAFITQRPELCRAALCAVPLLDMVRYHKFLVARFWVPEYGSADDPQQFEYLLKYSPYHNVKKGTKYPAVMFVTGDSDTRVDPCHARKMCALMQAATGSNRPILLHYDTKGGHSGGKPISQVIEETVDHIAFLFWQLEVEMK